MGQLTHTLDKLGWTIPIVPELDDLTVGGLVMGTGIETTSHKYGLFQHICLSYELVISDGSVIKCSEEENSDLFFSVPWSYGTLGFLTAVKIKMIPSKRFVKLTYKPAHTAAEADRIMNEELGKGGNGHMFVESLIFDKERSVVMVGDMVDSCEVSKLNEIGKWHKEWFFKHVETFLNKGTYTEYIPLRDYYHRHSRQDKMDQVHFDSLQKDNIHNFLQINFLGNTRHYSLRKQRGLPVPSRLASAPESIPAKTDTGQKNQAALRGATCYPRYACAHTRHAEMYRLFP